MSTDRVAAYFGEDSSGATWARVALARRQPDGTWAEDLHLHASARVQPGRDAVAAMKLASDGFCSLLRRNTAWTLSARAHQGK